MKKLLVFLVTITGSLFLSGCGSTDSTTNYQVSISASPSEGGTVSPSSGQYEEGTSLDISATPSKEYLFVKWQGDYQGTNSSATITVDSDKNIQAIFAKKEYALTINTEGEGTVDESILQTTSTTDYESGTIVELTANPAEGWKFVEWQGDITSTENPIQITVDEAKEVTAVFEKNSFAVTINTEGEGSVTQNPNQENYLFQSSLDLEATPATGYQFLKWQGDIESTENPVTVTVDSDPSFTAVFEKKSYPLTINIDGEGSVTKNPDQSEYKYQTSVSLTAEPAQGWKFVEWQGDTTSTEFSIELTIDQAKGVTAVFEVVPYTVDITLEGAGTVEKELVSGSQISDGYAYGSEVKVTVKANEGWNFVYWKEGFDGTENPITVIIEDSVQATASLDESPFAGGNGSDSYPYEISTLDQLQAINSFTNSNFIQMNDIDASATEDWNAGKGFRPIGDDVVKFTGTYNGKSYQIINLIIDRSDKFYVGLFGYAENGKIINVTLQSFHIEGKEYVGGIAGQIGEVYADINGKIENSYANGKIVGSARVGVLVGANGGYIKNSFAEGNASGTNYIGGLTGSNFKSIVNSHAEVNVVGKNNVGGLIGENSGKVRASFENGNVSGTNRVGGLVGWNRLSGEINESYAFGDVSGNESIGGLVGENNNGNPKIYNSYAHGKVEGNSRVGGLVGINNDEGDIKWTYATGIVTGSNDVGGLVGSNGATVSSSYWDTEVTGQNTGVGRGSDDGTISLTTSEMSGEAAEDNMARFDFSNIWITTNSYPILQGQN